MSSASSSILDKIIQTQVEDSQLLDTIIQKFNRLADDESTEKTHHFDGRFENIYPDKTRFPEMDNLKQIILPLAEALLSATEPLELGYWFNLMEPGHTTSLHTHEEDMELLSGVCYLQVPKDSGDIVFIYAGEILRLTPKVGDIFLFPPNLPHKVEKNCSGGTRLSVAFNIGPRR